MANALMAAKERSRRPRRPRPDRTGCGVVAIDLRPPPPNLASIYALSVCAVWTNLHLTHGGRSTVHWAGLGASMRLSTVAGAALLLCGIACASQAQPAGNQWPKSLTLGTASPGGVYYVYGEAVAQLLTEKLGIPVNALPTQGPVHNVKLVDSGGAQLGLITMGVGLQGWTGEGEWTAGKHFQNMRALFPMYDTTFQFVALRRSGITTLAQFDKRSVGVGPRAGTGGTYVPAILKAVGVTAQIGNGSFADMGKDLLGGRYDAMVMTGGVPFPALIEAEAQEPITFVSLTPQESEAVRKALPELTISEIEKGTYS